MTTRLVLECIVALEAKHFKYRPATAPEFTVERCRWVCQPCDRRGGWTTRERARESGEAHVLAASNRKESMS